MNPSKLPKDFGEIPSTHEINVDKECWVNLSPLPPLQKKRIIHQHITRVLETVFETNQREGNSHQGFVMDQKYPLGLQSQIYFVNDLQRANDRWRKHWASTHILMNFPKGQHIGLIFIPHFKRAISIQLIRYQKNNVKSLFF